MVGTWFAHGTPHARVQPGSVEFAALDVSLTRALASTVGVALEQRERIDLQRRQQAWQIAGMRVTMLLLSGADLRAVRSAVTDHAGRLDRAVGAAIIVPTEDPDLLRVAAGSGLLDPSSAGEFRQADDALAPLAATRNATTGTLDSAPAAAAALGADPADGVLLVARGSAGQPFRAPDVEMIASFATQVGAALALTETRRKRDLVRLVEDRERIAARLSDRAMRALLEISTTVHGLTARMQSAADAQRLAEQGDRLDGVLREMQRAIFGLPAPTDDWQGTDGWQGSAAR